MEQDHRRQQAIGGVANSVIRRQPHALALRFVQILLQKSPNRDLDCGPAASLGWLPLLRWKRWLE
jgi:hypothetical protein